MEAVDLGVAGGGIRISERGSGEIDSASELSRLFGKWFLLPTATLFALDPFDFLASSIIPENLLVGMMVLAV